MTPSEQGQNAEDQALAHLRQAGLALIARNFKSPGRGGGELDLVMRAPDSTWVFVEVRQRRSMAAGGAAASVSATKQRRIAFAAQHFLAQRFTNAKHLPPCRFDVVTVQGTADGRTHLEWIKAAFDLGSGW
jgi:putative endonuclease